MTKGCIISWFHLPRLWTGYWCCCVLRSLEGMMLQSFLVCFSAILYLNDDFKGGEFFFAHANKSEQVRVTKEYS